MRTILILGPAPLLMTDEINDGGVVLVLNLYSDKAGSRIASEGITVDLGQIKKKHV